MIAQIQNASSFDDLVTEISSQMDRMYPRFQVSCRSELYLKLDGLLKSSTHLGKNCATAYLKTCLKNEAFRFFRQYGERLDREQTNFDVEIHESKELSAELNDLQIDVTCFCLTLSTKEKLILSTTTHGNNVDEVAKQFGISSQAIYKARTKILERARNFLLEYKHDSN